MCPCYGLQAGVLCAARLAPRFVPNDAYYAYISEYVKGTETYHPVTIILGIKHWQSKIYVV